MSAIIGGYKPKEDWLNVFLRLNRPKLVSFAVFCAIMATLGAVAVRAANSSTVVGTPYGDCQWAGNSNFTHTPSNMAASKTYKLTGYGTCNEPFRVEADFHGSDGLYYNYVSSGYTSTQVAVWFPWWTDDVYGEHNYPAGMNTAYTHAY